MLFTFRGNPISPIRPSHLPHQRILLSKSKITENTDTINNTKPTQFIPNQNMMKSIQYAKPSKCSNCSGFK